MRKKPYVMKGVGKIEIALAGYGKNIEGKGSMREQIQKQDQKAQKGKSQSYRGVIAYAHYGG
jgi:hypothetical protein